MTNMERNIVKQINNHLKNKGIAYRLKQSRFTDQIVDVLVDSYKYHPLAIECKSVKYKKGRKVYFSQYFTTNQRGEHQISRISKFIRVSGRKGFLVIEKRKGRGYKTRTYAVPWKIVKRMFNDGKKGLRWSEIIKYKFKPKRLFKEK